MDAAGFDCQGYVGAGIDEESSSRFPVLSSQRERFVDDADCFPRQGFEFARGEIFFAELDIVDGGVGRFGDLLKKAATAGGFVCCERSAIGDVVEQAALSHQLSAIRSVRKTQGRRAGEKWVRR